MKPIASSKPPRGLERFTLGLPHRGQRGIRALRKAARRIIHTDMTHVEIAISDGTSHGRLTWYTCP